MLLPAVAWGQWAPPVPPGCPERPASEEEALVLAGRIFAQATERGNAGLYVEAVELFACCYYVAPHPNTLYNLGVAAEHAGDLRTAEAALQRYVEEAPGAVNRTETDGLLASIRERLAALPPPALPEPVPEPEPATRPPAAVVVAPQPPPSSPPPPEGMSALAIAGWSLLGAGALVAAAGGTTFAVLAADEADAANNPPPDTPWSTVAGHRDSFDTYTTWEIVAFAVGGAVALGGLVLLLVDASTEAPVEVLPAVTPDSAGLWLVGRF